jgi:hypothetical protein
MRKVRNNEPKNARLRGKRAVVYKDSTSAGEEEEDDYELEEVPPRPTQPRAKRGRPAFEKQKKNSTRQRRFGAPFKQRTGKSTLSPNNSMAG